MELQEASNNFNDYLVPLSEYKSFHIERAEYELPPKMKKYQRVRNMDISIIKSGSKSGLKK